MAAQQSLIRANRQGGRGSGEGGRRSVKELEFYFQGDKITNMNGYEILPKQ